MTQVRLALTAIADERSRSRFLFAKPEPGLDGGRRRGESERDVAKPKSNSPSSARLHHGPQEVTSIKISHSHLNGSVSYLQGSKKFLRLWALNNFSLSG